MGLNFVHFREPILELRGLRLNFFSAQMSQKQSEKLELCNFIPLTDFDNL